MPASAYIEYTESSKTECDGTRCYTTFYSGVMFAQDSDGYWVSPSDILSITKNQDDITFHYDGIKGYKSITFEAGAIYNGNYYSFSEIKQMKPEIEFYFPKEDQGTHIKYAINITNLDELDINLIENITLTYKSHTGFNLNQLMIENNRFKVKSIMGLYFDDLIDLYPISININERRLYISNITDNIIDGQIYLDPNLLLETAGEEIIDDAMVLERLPDANRGSIPTMNVPELDVTDQIVVSYIKFNMTGLPLNINVLWANLSLGIETNDVQDFNITATGVDNQTWKEDDITWNKQPTGIQAKPINNAFVDNTAFTNRWPLNVTEWIQTEHDVGKTFVSFLLNGTTNGLVAGACTAYTKERVAVADRPWLNITYELGTEISAGINISVFSAVDGITDIPSWSVTLSNGTGVLTSVNNQNPTVINISDLINISGPVVNVTIFKTGYENVTYNVSIDNTHIENVSAFIFTIPRGLIDINSPVNGSSVAGSTFFLNITSPGSISGFLNDLSYELNASGNFINLCSDCTGFLGAIVLGGFGSQSIVVRATSSNYSSKFVQSSFSNLFATYNLLIMDELRNVTFDISLAESANLTAFCPTAEPSFDIIGNFTPLIDIGCEFNYLQLNMKLHNQSASHFRTLIPDFDAKQVTFYMIDNITKVPDDNFIDVKIILDDLTGNFRNGIVHIRKAINGSIVDIIDQQVDSESSILAYLVIGERYFLSIESANGRITKSLGDLFIRDETETEKRLQITELDLIEAPEGIIFWEFLANITEEFINLTYNDTFSQTNTITFFIFNVTDPTNFVLLFNQTIDGNSDVSFSWNNATTGNTYLARFVADHDTFGEIRQDQVFIFSDRPFPLAILEVDPVWYTIIALLVIMMTSLLFGAAAAQFGVVVIAIEAAFFALIGWLDITNPGVLMSLLSLVMLMGVLAWIGLRRREQ